MSKPLKPAQQFALGIENGIFTGVHTLISLDKEAQERFVIRQFQNGLPDYGRSLQDIAQLPENDHDFQGFENQEKVIGQIVEIPTREYVNTIPISDGYTDQSFDGKGGAFLVLEGKLININHEIFSEVLIKTIKKKLAKNYQKPLKGRFILLIYSLGPYVITWPKDKGGVIYDKRVIKEAQTFLKTIESPFDEIWYVDPINPIIRIWPKLTGI